MENKVQSSVNIVKPSYIVIEIDIPSEFFKVVPVGPSRSHTYHLHASKQGSVGIKASLLRVFDNNSKKYKYLEDLITFKKRFQ
ncbi:hypothetical protein DICPUDRAFT_160049 [Dictyostelium purpureum]|uniref:Uncharacterized protein n=1 Tax=Dictyostelium purpureum TaxID=5786 RepID=F1A5L1_DICPU|nr:uncharacterized protein DICPUDRAFT_160049 [Dictyostelium purpureum]EGC28520.1 hypothetical protein DICPUDRAFT_160049 [Dictyostelium purpureum]|eukprot:XP_003294955.1 hypothetical protein DICPUDRAFT_160049 [Dictyostelium purpureum]